MSPNNKEHPKHLKIIYPIFSFHVSIKLSPSMYYRIYHPLRIGLGQEMVHGKAED